MGAAIECFAGAGAVCVPRSRFAPVKKCSDLLLLRSDAYEVNAQSVLVLSAACNGVAPIVDLDDKKYKLVQHLEAATGAGYPSLKGCRKVKSTNIEIFSVLYEAILTSLMKIMLIIMSSI